MPKLAELLGSDDIEGVRSMGCEPASDPAVDPGKERTPAAVGGTTRVCLLCSSPWVLAGADAVAAGMLCLGAGAGGCVCLGLLGASSLCCASCAPWLAGASALFSSRMLARSGAF